MRLCVGELDAVDTWKDIVRINKKYRESPSGRPVRRGSICSLRVNDRAKWVVAHGRESSDAVIQMDLTTRLALKVKPGETYEFTLKRMSWVKSFAFPWRASDPIYRVPAQIALIGLALGVLAIIIGLLPLFIHMS